MQPAHLLPTAALRPASAAAVSSWHHALATPLGLRPLPPHQPGRSLPIRLQNTKQAAPIPAGASYSHLWEPKPALFRDPSVQAPTPLSIPPVSSSRVLTWLSAWHREVSSKRGPSSRMDGAEIDVIERQLPAPASGAEAWTLNSKGAQDSGENRRLQMIAAARGLLQLMHQRTARGRTRTGPWNPGRPPTG